MSTRKEYDLGPMGTLALLAFQDGELHALHMKVADAEQAHQAASRVLLAVEGALKDARKHVVEAETIFACKAGEAVGVPWPTFGTPGRRWVRFNEEFDKNAVLVVEEP